MRDTRYIILVLLSSLLMLTGCSRRDVLDDYPVSGVEISLDWAGVTDELPEGVRIIFYPKDGEGRKVDRYLSVQGGEMKVPSFPYPLSPSWATSPGLVVRSLYSSVSFGNSSRKGRITFWKNRRPLPGSALVT